MLKIPLKILDKELYTLLVPYRATEKSSGFDLRLRQDVYLSPLERKKIGTGIAINMSECSSDDNKILSALIIPRSGLGTKGLVFSNLIGLIDNDYQGELILSLWNNSHIFSLNLKRGTRVAQLVFIETLKVAFNLVNDFKNLTDRGFQGFGSTGEE